MVKFGKPGVHLLHCAVKFARLGSLGDARQHILDEVVLVAPALAFRNDVKRDVDGIVELGHRPVEVERLVRFDPPGQLDDGVAVQPATRGLCSVAPLIQSFQQFDREQMLRDIGG